MKEYKRLTSNIKDADGFDIDFCKGCHYYGTQDGGCGTDECMRPDGECPNYIKFCEIYNRLSDLEDEIEKRTLINLPCKIGDKVYRITGPKKRKIVVERFVFSVTVRRDGYEIFTTTADMLGVSVFLTKEQAEQKLKELKERRCNG